jgi:hypothetical protein
MTPTQPFCAIVLVLLDGDNFAWSGFYLFEALFLLPAAGDMLFFANLCPVSFLLVRRFQWQTSKKPKGAPSI